MEILEFVCIMTAIIVSGLLIFVWMSTKNAIKMAEFAERTRLSDLRSKAAKAKWQQDEPELGSWVTELAQAFGFNVESLFSDQMPPEISKLLPLAKGFIQGGGLKKLLGGDPAAGEGDQGDRSAI
jgi:hypothetical protein